VSGGPVTARGHGPALAVTTPDASPSVVVVGSGSAGRRHVRALLAIDPSLRITVVRRHGSATTEFDPPSEQIRLAPSLDEALDGDTPAIGIVASPATHHCPDALAMLDAVPAVLVEKPLAHDVADAAALAAADPEGRRLEVGYHLRWSETAGAVHHAVHRGVIGRLTSFDLRVGQHLADWRPDTDARRSVSARSELGGGVLLELSHELDAVRWLLGPITDVGARLRVDGAPTDGVVDTIADLDVRAGGVLGTVHLDMVARPAMRVWEVRGTEGVIRADLIEGTVEMAHGPGPGSVLHRSAPGERDRAARALITQLFRVAGGSPARCSATEAAATVAVVDAARRSNDLGGGSLPVGGDDMTGRRVGGGSAPCW
jgi:predicted dehydrogenase